MALRGTARSLVVLLLALAPATASAATATVVMQPSTSSAASLPGPYSILDNDYCTSVDGSVWSVTSHVAARIKSTLPFSGRVYDANWNPLAGTTVTLYRFGYRSSDKVVRVASKRTSAGGDFSFRIRDPQRTFVYWTEVAPALSTKVNSCTNSTATWDIFTGVSDPVLVYTQPVVSSVKGRRRGSSVLVSGKVTALQPKVNGKVVVRLGRKVLKTVRTNNAGSFTAPLGIRRPGSYHLTVTYQVNTKRGDYYLDATRALTLTIPRQATPVKVKSATPAAVAQPVNRPVTGTVRCPFSDRKKCPAGT
jgi:hypothetical protein